MEHGTLIKIRDVRDGTTFSGTFEKFLLAGESPSDEDIARFYKLKPMDSQYESIKRPISYERIVLSRGDHSYFIIPASPSYALFRVPDTREEDDK